MAAVKDICRICLRETHYDDVQQIDLKKLGKLIEKFFLPKWDLQLLQDHMICNICIDNFRTLKLLYKCTWKGNALVMRTRQKSSKYAHLKEIDLKHLDRFQELKGDFVVCRLCLEPTKHIAIWLSENDSNILPRDYINKMLKCVRLYMTLLDITLNPILCFKCWQRIQISFSFRKHLDVVTEKIQRYEQLTSKKIIDREGLQHVLHMWDKLVPSDIEKLRLTENHISVPSMQDTPRKKKKKIPKTMPILTPEYGLVDEHNYFRKRLPNLTAQMPSEIRSESETSSSVDVENYFKATELKKLNVADKLRSPQVKNKRSNYKKKGNKKKKPAKKTSIKDSAIEDSFIDSSFMRRTRLSAKKEVINELNSKDLLVLKKEEILKKKPFRNCKPSFMHTSTPHTQDSPHKTQLAKSPSKHPINEFTFERLNFDNEVQTDQITLEEEEVQIKREVISDSDDDFIETALPIRDEQCPNLDVFIKTEPEEIIDVNEDEEDDEPPELEFQGPCNYDPKFVISNTFTVNDKRHLVNTLDEKRNFINSAAENSSGSVLQDKLSGKIIGSISPQRSLLKSKRLESLQPKTDPKGLNNMPIIRDVIIDLYKCDKKSVSDLQPSKTISPPTIVSIEKKEQPYLSFNSPIRCIKTQSKNSKIANLGQIIIPATKSIQVGPMNHNKVMPILLPQPRNEVIENHSGCSVAPKLIPNNLSHEENKDEKLAIDKLYAEISGLIIDLSHPYKCKICDFKTNSSRGAKVHLSLHRNNSANVHSCKFCSYKTTKKKNLKRHTLHTHTGTCGICKLPEPKVNCTSCHKTFHADCLMTRTTKDIGCHHFTLSHCMTIALNGIVTIFEKGTPPSAKCSVCLISMEKWVNCQQCKKFFHYNCLYFSRTNELLCRHFVYSHHQNQMGSKNGDIIPNNQKKKRSENRNCDFCSQALDSVIPCPVCMKFMHQACYQKDSRQMRFGCKHTDIVGEAPRAETQTTTRMPEPTASTSKELKREMLNLTEFIMLCD